MKGIFRIIDAYSRRYYSSALLAAVVLFTAGFQTACPPVPDVPSIETEFDPRFHDRVNNGEFTYPTTINAVAIDNRTGNFVIGGRFSAVDNVQAYNIAMFDRTKNRYVSLFGNGLILGSSAAESYVNTLKISGRYLYIGGLFSQTAHGVTGMNNFAIYDLDQRTWIQPKNGGLVGEVRTFEISASGLTLFVGGSFYQTHDGTIVNLSNIASYNLVASCMSNCWSALPGNGLNNTVNALEFDSAGRLYAGGEFTGTPLGGVPGLNRIARLDPSISVWEALPDAGLDGRVNALEFTSQGLFVGGNFTQTANATQSLNKLAAYTASGWSAITGNTLNGEVKALSARDLYLAIGGEFSFTGTAPNGVSSNILFLNWDPANLNQWEDYDQGFSPGLINALQWDGLPGLVGERLVAVGTFEQSVGGFVTNMRGIADMYFSYVGGFQESSQLGTGSLDISSATISSLGLTESNALNAVVTSLVADSSGKVYAGGGFTRTASGTVTNLNRIARYDPATSTWSPLGNNGLNGSVSSIAIDGNFLYVGGDFTATADGSVTNLNRVARYNLTTNTWSSLANNGLNSPVRSLLVHGGDLFVGGMFTRTFDSSVANLNNIARLNLTTNTWSPLANNGLNGLVISMAAIGDNLYVGGFFTRPFSIASPTMNNIGRYNTVSNTWSALANNGVNSFAQVLKASGNYLYVSGNFGNTGDFTITLNGLARYDTQTNAWLRVGGDTDDRAAARLTYASVQVGNELYVGGNFRRMGDGVATYFTRFYLQKWDVPAATTDWFDPMNWTTNAVPAANSNAVIPSGAGNIEINSADVVMSDLIINGGTLSIGAGRTLTINGILGLNGGMINGDGTLIITNCQQEGIMGGSSTSYIQTALIRCVASGETFNFEVGTANGYSPITIKNVAGTGNILVKANQGPYSGPAMYLPANRLSRWWQIENPGGGVTNSEVNFSYGQSDVVGSEAGYSAFRISGGLATAFNSTPNTFSNTVTVPNVSAFSDWTLAEFGPTAAGASVGGRVLTADGNGINKAIVTLTSYEGNVRRVVTNAFGYYRFDDVDTGQTYVVSVISKRYSFAFPTRVITVTDHISDADFVAEPME